MAELTPMMRQYIQIKQQYPDTLLFFRLGDFYEMFFEDAKTASIELELVLTSRECGGDERAPMCGVPYHCVDNYIARLVSKGYKVAICEQMEDPALAKGIVKRDITRVLTPGTVIESNMLDEGKNNYLASVYVHGKKAGIAFSDISTGEIHLTVLDENDLLSAIINEIGKYSPAEIIMNSEASTLKGFDSFIEKGMQILKEVMDDEYYDEENCVKYIDKLLSKKTEEYSFCNIPEAVSALGSSVRYLSELQKSDLKNIREIDYYREEGYMRLNMSSRRNLELVETMRNKEKRGSLLWVIDKTKCSMGKRMIRRWLENPLTGYSSIIRRNRAVEELYNDTVLLADIRFNLANVNDLERIMARIIYGTANAKELRSLKSATEILPYIKTAVSGCKSEMLSAINDNLDILEDINNTVENAIVDEPPFSVREGGMIRRGYNEELDVLKDIEADSVKFINDMALNEQEKTGIKKLKIGYNHVFGYYIEVPNAFKEDVPENYIRKQTLTNCERFITEELKELESKILSAKEKIVRIEYELFTEIREEIASQFMRVRTTADAVAQLDVLCSLAHVARSNNYCCPEIVDADRLEIIDGRHPVVELMQDDAPFVPNDTVLDCGENRCAIITGPNMAGKSTYMRQVALIVLMAQIGSFVPAKSAVVGICDSIFTRVGASDDLASGQSTFMVEMSEVAGILKEATNKSLIIYDEIGRGTSTFDGMSIARAVLEFTADSKKLGAKTLFATHYHELTELEGQIEGVKNYNIAVKKRGEDITFLRRIIRGSADGSYGVEVAKLAGVPVSVVKRARVILDEIESGAIPVSVMGEIKNNVPEFEDDIQVSFGSNAGNELIEEISKIDVNTLTPIEAMSKLYEIVNKSREI